MRTFAFVLSLRTTVRTFLACGPKYSCVEALLTWVTQPVPRLYCSSLLRHKNTQHLQEMFGPFLKRFSLLGHWNWQHHQAPTGWCTHAGFHVFLHQKPFGLIFGSYFLSVCFSGANRVRGLFDFWSFLLCWWYKTDNMVGEELEGNWRLRRKITRSLSRCSASRLLIQVATSSRRDQQEAHPSSSWRKCTCKRSMEEKRDLYFFRQCSVLKCLLYIKM